MKFDKVHWLETVEYILIAASAIGAVVVIASGTGNFVLLILVLTLFVNLLNRLRLEQRNRKSRQGLVKQLKAQSQEKANLENKVAIRPDKADVGVNSGTSYQDAIAFLQDDLASLEDSLSGVVQYMNQSSLSARLEYLEQVIANILPQVTGMSKEECSAANSIQANSQSPVVIQSLRTQKNLLDLPLPHSPQQKSLTANPQRWQYQQRLNGHQSWVTSLAFSSNHQWLASVSWDKTLKLWQPATGQLLAVSPEEIKGLWAVTFIGNQGIATGGYDQTIRLWQLNPQGDKLLGEQTTLSGHTGSIRSLLTTPDQKNLLSGSYDQSLKVWWLEKKELLQSLEDTSGDIRAIALSEDGQMIASGGGAGCVNLWQWGNPQPLSLLQGNSNSVESLAINRDRRCLAAGCANGTITLWNLDTEALGAGDNPLPTHQLQGHTGQVQGVVFCRDSRRLISGSTDGKVVIWDTRTGNAIALLTPDSEVQSPIISLTLSPDGQILAVGRMDGAIDLWRQQ